MGNVKDQKGSMKTGRVKGTYDLEEFRTPGVEDASDRTTE